MSNHDTWTTVHELNMISEAGKGRTQMQYLQWLKNYQSAVKFRQDWGSINPERVNRHVRNIICELITGGKDVEEIRARRASRDSRVVL